MKKVLFAAVIILSLFLELLAPSSRAEAAFSSEKVVQEGKKYIGVHYRYGGTTPSGFDCSGFVGYTYRKATGKILPRTASGIFSTGQYVSRSSLKKGDIVFFSTIKSKRGASHTGIYIGGSKFIHASTSKGVSIDSLKTSYWRAKFIGARRL
ncbi:C40 family peptidase [Bacillus sp. MUM 13]|uniref:C40 family peptidase n=1 Tax=Bacillus sp. MUM 13 TaxID=1678001 RepID=UPI0008F5D457|nr:C40 family peptidase [Bacillus sp. MUM 13]OIK11665.1 peptidase P60 [Bacillus sp. MUM 13]